MNRIPIIIDGVTRGQLELRREGAYMVCRGRAEWSGNMVRLWLHGNGRSEYLGVLQHDGTVRKRFTLSEFSRLPNPIACCTDSAGEEPRQADEETGDVLWVRQPDGTLVCREGNRQLIALPADEVRLPRGCRFLLRRIEGRDYVIFPY